MTIPYFFASDKSKSKSNSNINDNINNKIINEHDDSTYERAEKSDIEMVSTVSTAPTTAAASAVPRVSPRNIRMIDRPNRDQSKHTKTICIASSFFCPFAICVIIIVPLVFLLKSRSSSGGSGSTSFSGTGTGGGGGVGGGSSCFPAGELVQLESDGESFAVVPVEHLQPGDIVREGGLIKALMKLIPSEQEVLYRYNNSVWVTGMHAVLEGKNISSDGALTYVQDSIYAEDIPTDHFWDPMGDFLFNVVTTSHRMVINGTIFADWEEVDYCSKNLINRLNNPHAVLDISCEPHEIDEDPSDPIDEGSFSAGMMISRKGTKFPATPIENIKPGDWVESGTVLATIKIFQEEGGSIYSYGKGLERVEATKWTIVNHAGEWQYIQDISDATHVGTLKSGAIFYQLITSSHRIVTASGHIFSDYEVVDESASKLPPSSLNHNLRGVFSRLLRDGWYRRAFEQS